MVDGSAHCRSSSSERDRAGERGLLDQVDERIDDAELRSRVACELDLSPSLIVPGEKPDDLRPPRILHSGRAAERLG